MRNRLQTGLGGGRVGAQDGEAWRIPQAAVDGWLAKNGFVGIPWYKRTWVLVSGGVVLLAALFGFLEDSFLAQNFLQRLALG